jgi:hypothetical protein
MKALIVAALISLFPIIANADSLPTDNGDGRFAPPVPTVERYEVSGDGGGGAVEEFKDALKFIKTTGRGIKLSGMCASACTLMMDESLGLDVCVTPGANLRFHKPFMARFGLAGYEIVKTIPAIHNIEKMWEKDFYKKYPLWIRTEIDKNGGVPSVYTGSQPSDMFIIGFDTLKRNMTVC